MNYQTDYHHLKGHFPLGGIFLAERHFLLFKDQLEESGYQKTKGNIILRGKFLLVENDPNNVTKTALIGLRNKNCSDRVFTLELIVVKT